MGGERSSDIDHNDRERKVSHDPQRGKRRSVIPSEKFLGRKRGVTNSFCGTRSPTSPQKGWNQGGDVRSCDVGKESRGGFRRGAS